MTATKLMPITMLALMVASCTVLGLPRTEAPSLFTLNPNLDGDPGHGSPTEAIAVAAPVARPGYDGVRMVYVTRAYQIQFFARHEWVAPPAQMLAPLLVEALERAGRFRAVQSAADVAPPFRLETEIVALRQEFTATPSQTRFVLRAMVVDTAGRRVLAAEEFEAVEPAPSEDPYGGVVAANQAASRVLNELAQWCDTHTPHPAVLN